MQVKQRGTSVITRLLKSFTQWSVSLTVKAINGYLLVAFRQLLVESHARQNSCRCGHSLRTLVYQSQGSPYTSSSSCSLLRFTPNTECKIPAFATVVLLLVGTPVHELNLWKTVTASAGGWTTHGFQYIRRVTVRYMYYYQLP